MKKTKFQSTLPRGERRFFPCKFVHYSSNFNPRSHEGSDVHVVGIPFKVIWDFNPRSHEGSDGIAEINAISGLDFNPRSHEGSDHVVGIPFKVIWDFNPRSHEGSDSNFRQKVLFSLSKNCLKYLILTTNYFK